MKIGLIIFLVFLTVFNANSQVETFDKQIRAKENLSNLPDSLFLSDNCIQTLIDLEPYLEDSLPDVVKRVIPNYVRAGLNCMDSLKRREVVSNLVDLLNDYGFLIRYLKRFEREDFNLNARLAIIQVVKNTKANTDLILLSGFLQLKEIQPFLKKMAYSKEFSIQIKWNALLALTRMGNEKSKSDVIKMIEQLRVNDDFVYDVIPGIIFTKNKEIYNLVLNKLLEELEPCASPNPDNSSKVPCFCLALGAFAEVIPQFPLKVTSGGDLINMSCKQAHTKLSDWIGTEYRLDFNTF